MSLQALTWAITDAPLENSTDLAVLVAMAERADSHGRNAFESLATLAYKSRNSESTTRRSLARLLDTGVIKLGDQRAAEYIRADRRPTVYDLCLDRRRDEPLPPTLADCTAQPPDHTPPDNDETPDDLRAKYHPPSPPAEPGSRGVNLTPRDQSPCHVTNVTGCQSDPSRGVNLTPEPITKPTTYRTPNGVLPGDESPGDPIPALFKIDDEKPPPPTPPKSRTATKHTDPLITAAQELARGWYDAVGGFGNFPAVMGVVRKALRAGEPPESVAAALARLAEDNRPVTTDSLRIECRGVVWRSTHHDQRSNAQKAFALADEYEREANPFHDDPPLELVGAGRVIDGSVGG
jgi:hypothetical protein